MCNIYYDWCLVVDDCLYIECIGIVIFGMLMFVYLCRGDGSVFRCVVCRKCYGEKDCC